MQEISEGPINLTRFLPYACTNDNGKNVRVLRRLRVGDVIETRLRRDGGLSPELRSSFVSVLCFVQSRGFYALGVKMEELSQNRYRPGTDDVVIVPLKDAVPALATHKCTRGSSCVNISSSGKVTGRNCPPIFSGGVFYVIGRAQGYPSRSA